MKKVSFLIMSALIVWSIAFEADTGAGLQFGYPGDVALTVKLDHFPVAGLSWSFGSSTYLGTTIDYWLANNKISDTPLTWYYGGGISASINTGSGDKIGLGLRAPIGLQFYPAKQIETYLELAPGLAVLPGIGFDIGAALGFRYHF